MANTEIRKPAKAAKGNPVTWLDDRLGLAAAGKKNLRKIFPDHWSFMLGEIALWSFVILLLTGTFLTLWFKPSMSEIPYEGTYTAMRGVLMSEAYASTLDISFDVRAGLLMRQMHHWAALLFVAAMMLHMLRVLFTGAYRKPREVNYMIGLLLLMLGILEGFAGYSLPDDLLSGTGLRIAQGLILSIPVLGSYVSSFLFGGDFPGNDLVPRLYTVHVLLLPGIILGLIAAHMLLLVYHKHTQWPGPGRTEKNVVGFPMLPVYAAKAGGFFFVVFGVVAFMGAFMQINAIWVLGPYNPTQVMAGSQPDFYMAMPDGLLRLMPNWESELWGYTISWNVLIPGVVLPGVLFTVGLLFPFIERWISGDNREHHLLERPRNAPGRTAFLVGGMTFYGIAWFAGGDDVISQMLGLDLNLVTRGLQLTIIAGPVIAFIITRRWCLSLQRHDREMVLHGYESGVIVRSVEGAYSEIHGDLDPDHAYKLTAHDRVDLPELDVEATDANGVRRPDSGRERTRRKLAHLWYGDDIAKPTRAELDEAHSHGHDDSHQAHPDGIAVQGHTTGDTFALEPGDEPDDDNVTR